MTKLLLHLSPNPNAQSLAFEYVCIYVEYILLLSLDLFRIISDARCVTC